MSVPVVLFPDATDLVIAYLGSSLAARGETAPVRSQVPKDRPPKYVVIRRVGGVRRNLVSDGARITYECSASSEEEAADLAQLVRALILAMKGTVQDGHAIYGTVETGGPAFLPDPLADLPRYVGEIEVGIRGAAA